MPWAIPAGMAAAGLASGLLGYFAQKSASDRAAMLYNDNFKRWMELNIPDPEEQKIALETFVQTGELVPTLETAVRQDPSAFESIVTDQKYQSAQNRALSELEKLGYEGGLNLSDKAALQDAQMEQQVADRSNREGIVDEMARRGLGGSGFDMTARLQAQQGTSDQAARNSLKVAAGAQDRALSAIQSAGDMATKYRTQDFGEKAQKATAADRINAFNTQNLRDVNHTNTGLINRANEMNLGERQRISDQNTSLRNSQEIHNKGLRQQQFENESKRLAGANGMVQGEANTALGAGQNAANLWSNIGQSTVGGLSAYGQMEFWDKYFKNKGKA